MRAAIARRDHSVVLDHTSILARCAMEMSWQTAMDANRWPTASCHQPICQPLCLAHKGRCHMNVRGSPSAD